MRSLRSFLHWTQSKHKFGSNWSGCADEYTVLQKRSYRIPRSSGSRQNNNPMRYNKEMTEPKSNLKIVSFMMWVPFILHEDNQNHGVQRRQFVVGLFITKIEDCAESSRIG